MNESHESMSIENLKNQLPEYAKDLKLNLSSLVNSPEGMSDRQLWGTLLASALASRNRQTVLEIASEAAEHLDEAATRAAKIAASLMGMNNVYYRFLHLVSEKSYTQNPAGLRMTAIGNPGVDKIDFELWCLAVSAINGCGKCIDAHERTLAQNGMDRKTIQHAIRLAAVVHAVAVTFDGEEFLPR